MVCRMPPVMIPDDFLQILDLQYNNRSRRDLNTSALSVTGPNGMDQAIIYLGFILDGYQKYKNINDVLPDTRILIFSLPNINFTKDVLEFDPGKDELISIKVDLHYLLTFAVLWSLNIAWNGLPLTLRLLLPKCVFCLLMSLVSSLLPFKILNGCHTNFWNE